MNCEIKHPVTYLCSWTAIWWPQKIINEMKAVTSENADHVKHFQKIQIAEQNDFEKHLEHLQVW